jgi:hypothetical protein
VWELLKRQKES